MARWMHAGPLVVALACLARALACLAQPADSSKIVFDALQQVNRPFVPSL